MCSIIAISILHLRGEECPKGRLCHLLRQERAMPKLLLHVVGNSLGKCWKPSVRCDVGGGRLSVSPTLSCMLDLKTLKTVTGLVGIWGPWFLLSEDSNRGKSPSRPSTTAFARQRELSLKRTPNAIGHNRNGVWGRGLEESETSEEKCLFTE